MLTIRLRGGLRAAVVSVLASAGCTSPDGGVAGTGEWPMYRGDPAGTGYSPLSEIDENNVSTLQTAWTYSVRGDPLPGGEPGREPNSQATPIVVGGVMYLPAADRVVALDPATGGELWRHVLDDGVPSRRGVAYWPGDGAEGPRIIFAAASRLIALDAVTGTPAAGFGERGVVEMGIPYNSVPLVHEDVVVVGANTPPGTPGGVGNARAFDARTGERLWEFSSVPQPGEIGHDSWGGDSWVGRLGVNAWPFYFTVDEERSLVFLPLAAPLPWHYGGDRPGDNLFGNSVVAVDIRTGAYVWHFQTIHHDLWDHDPPAPPVLFDIPSPDGPVPALGVTTKSGYLYILNRETGEPVFGVDEMAVPPSDVPGERASPTQPVPVSPPPLARVRFGTGDLVGAEDTSPEHAEACAALLASVGDVHHAGPFTPWVYRSADGPPRTTLLFPGLSGGPNWGGVAYDPNRGYLLVFSQDLGSFGWLEGAPPGSPVPYSRSGPSPASFDVEMGGARWPCHAPPWGRMTAVDATTGEIAWQEPVGVTDGLPPEKANTGRPGRAGAIVTASGLVFVAATDDARLRALSATTGEELWVTRLERRGNASPMTYLGPDGRQYLAVAATDEIVAFRLP